MSERPQHDCLATALAAAQANYMPIAKAKRSPAFGGYSYADLAPVLAAVRPALAAQGIALVQRFEITEQGDTVLVSELLWRDQRETSRVPLKIAGLDNQKAGIAVTYWRRYSALALAGVHPEDEDDDGAEAQASPVRREQQRPEPPRHEPAAEDDRGQRTFPLNGKRYRADDWIVEADRVARALEPGRLSGFLEATKATRNEIYKSEAAARDRLMALSEDLKARALGAAASEGTPQ